MFTVLVVTVCGHTIFSDFSFVLQEKICLNILLLLENVQQSDNLAMVQKVVFDHLWLAVLSWDKEEKMRESE